ncbi:MAG: NUDIX hydrolase [Chitinophagaceae bacterium]
MQDEDLKWKTLSSEYLFKDTWLTARKDKCERADGKIIEPYYVMEYPEWVNAFAVTTDNKILLVKQYRHAAKEVSIETPGGCVDATDINFEDAMRRELLEETGYSFETVHSLGRISANPSTNNNWMHMFIALGGHKIQEQNLDPNEQIEIMELSFDELMQVLDEKRIIQAMHVTTIFYALRYLNKINYTL